MFHFFEGETCTLSREFNVSRIFRAANSPYPQKSLISYFNRAHGKLRVKVVETHAWATSSTKGLLVEEVVHITLTQDAPYQFREDSWIVSSEDLVRP